MRRYSGSILLLGCMLTASVVWGQTEGARVYTRRVDSSRLERARVRRQHNSTEAIRLVKESLAQSLRAGKTSQTAEEYTFLGELYADIDQPALALLRYEEALAMWTALARLRKQAETLDRIGRTHLALGRSAPAKQSYEACLALVQEGDALMLKCQEGLADAQRMAGRFAQSDTLYQALNFQFGAQGDSLGVSRIYAKQSQNYLQNVGDLSNANLHFVNSIRSLPSEVDEYAAYRSVEEANAALLDSAATIEDQLALTQSTLRALQTRRLPKVITLRERMRLAGLSIERGDVTAAVEALAEPDIETIDAATRAEFHRLSSSISFRQNDFTAAAKAYERYVAANEELLQEQTQALAQQATILREQSAVDLLMKDFLLRASEQNLLKTQVRNQWIFIALLGALLAAVGIGLWSVRKQSVARNRANQLLRLKALRAQMNPHFIFNALTSINNFIAKQDERSANRYLADFSRLMRLVLQYSERDFVSLEEEVELLTLYLKLEHARFGDQFDYTIDVDECI